MITDNLPGPKIGILGAGHLGITLAEVFLNTFKDKQNLLLSRSGSAGSIAAIEKLQLGNNLCSNQQLCTQTDITFILLRPQNLSDLGKMQVAASVLFVSGMAGVTLSALESKFGSNICRIMTSGPATIKSGKAVVAIYPYNLQVASLMTKAGFEIYRIDAEEDLHYFTVGVCLPAAIVLAARLKLDINPGIDSFSLRYSLFNRLHQWALAVVPQFEFEMQMDTYIKKMCTSGGVTEAIVNTLHQTNNIVLALEAGVNKSRALAGE